MLADSVKEMRSLLTGTLIFSGMFAGPPCHAAQRDVGPLTCGQQRDACVAYRRANGPLGSEGLAFQFSGRA